MSNGPEHLAAYKKGWKILPIFTFAVWCSTAFCYWPPIEKVLQTLEMACFLYGLGYWIDPDLDQPGVSSADSRMSKIWIIGIPLFLWWTLYALLMGMISKASGGKSNLDSHRKWFTHSLWGTAFRVIWIYIPFVPLFLYMAWNISAELIWQIIIATFIGLGVADGIHYVKDGIW